ncbi:restriction endonuclease subunit S, partial [Vibrio harveyi]|nr:restriction endonuclease subunit S [Vibrio harveyi]
MSISDMNANVDLKTTKKYISRKALNSYFNNSLTEKETLIMSFKLTVGKTSILGIDAVHNEGIISIYPYYDKNYVFRDFLMLVLPIITKFGNKKGAIKGDTLNSKSLSNLFIPIPPLTEQQKIVNIIKYLNLKIDNYSNLEKELINIEKELHIKLEKSIINYAMQGKLVKQDEKDNSVDKLIDEIYKEKEKLVKVGKVKNTELKDLIIYKNSDDNSYYE